MKYFTCQTSKQTAEGTDRSINAHPLHLDCRKVRQIRRRRAKKTASRRLAASALTVGCWFFFDGSHRQETTRSVRWLIESFLAEDETRPPPVKSLDAFDIFLPLLEAVFFLFFFQASLPPSEGTMQFFSFTQPGFHAL